MACPRCGEVCICSSEGRASKPRSNFYSPSDHWDAPAPSPGSRVSLIDPEASDYSEERFAASLDEGEQAPAYPDRPARRRFLADQEIEAQVQTEEGAPESDASFYPEPALPVNPGAEGTGAGTSTRPQPDGAAGSWRNEVTARVQGYRKRKPSPPRYPSLQLRFDAIEPRREFSAAAAASAMPAVPAPEAVEPAIPKPDENDVPESDPEPEVQETTAKIIEFPRFFVEPPPPGDELAGPVVVSPRILDVPDAAPPPPALGGILIEEPQKDEPLKRPGIDIPLQSAPMERRLLATFLDGLLVLTATAVFGAIFYKLDAPPLLLVPLAAAGALVAVLLWIMYQYLFLVYTGSTPGLRLAKLQLSRFDGSAAPRSLRRWRVIASVLSAASLGMGYAWFFLDEDSLCWHDRITNTYLGPRSGPDSA